MGCKEGLASGQTTTRWQSVGVLLPSPSLDMHGVGIGVLHDSGRGLDGLEESTSASRVEAELRSTSWGHKSRGVSWWTI